MIYTLSSELRSRGDVLRIGRQVEKWCRTNMGINNRKKYQPVITYYKSYEEDTDMGEYRYWDNEIIVYYNNCKTVSNLIRTIVHEWQHQLQPMTKYEKIHDEVGYDEHPFEKEAEAVEKKNYKQVWSHIKPTINKTKI
jgi:Zn-dependent peptidase ImmA (M78 family)